MCNAWIEFICICKCLYVYMHGSSLYVYASFICVYAWISLCICECLYVYMHGSSLCICKCLCVYA